MQIVVNNFHGDDLSWLPKGEVFIYDKKDKNVGSNIYDYMSWIVDHYDKLDDVVLFTKGNMLKRHITPEEWDKVKDNKTFTPLLTQHHKTYLPVCWYEDGLFCERNDFWCLNEYPARDIGIISLLGMNGKEYNKFAPGACYIVPKENILKHPKEFYIKLRDSVDYSQHPGEAYLIERSLYNIWNGEKLK